MGYGRVSRYRIDSNVKHTDTHTHILKCMNRPHIIMHYAFTPDMQTATLIPFPLLRLHCAYIKQMRLDACARAGTGMEQRREDMTWKACSSHQCEYKMRSCVRTCASPCVTHRRRARPRHSNALERARTFIPYSVSNKNTVGLE